MNNGREYVISHELLINTWSGYMVHLSCSRGAQRVGNIAMDIRLVTRRTPIPPAIVLYRLRNFMQALNLYHSSALKRGTRLSVGLHCVAVSSLERLGKCGYLFSGVMHFCCYGQSSYLSSQVPTFICAFVLRPAHIK